MKILKAKEYDPKKMVYPCYGSVKFDGHWCWADSSAYTKNGNRVIGVQHIEKQAQAIEGPLVGELIIPGKSFAEASGLIRNHSNTPNAVLAVFDMPNLPGTYAARYNQIVNNKDIQVASHIKVVKHHLLKDKAEADAFYKKHVSLGQEGVVYKDPNNRYQDGATWEWMKRVPIKSVECAITGMFEGKGKHVGRMGGLICDYNGTEVRVGTGFTDTQREEYWQQPSTIAQSIATIEYKSVTHKGSLRHPRFKELRWDNI